MTRGGTLKKETKGCIFVTDAFVLRFIAKAEFELFFSFFGTSVWFFPIFETSGLFFSNFENYPKVHIIFRQIGGCTHWTGDAKTPEHNAGRHY
jgi:hypothetical protein